MDTGTQHDKKTLQAARGCGRRSRLPSRDGLSCAASTAKRSAAGAVDGADMVSSGVARRSAAAAAAAVAEDGVVTAAQPNVRGQGSNNSRRGPFQGG
eukprot:359938-Chlamydomonas_euryale.AAC.2